MDLNVPISKILIGSRSVNITNHFDSLTYEILSSSEIGNTITVSLYDDTEVIEDMLINSGREFSVMFPGYFPMLFDLTEVTPTYGQITAISFSGVSKGCTRMDLNTRSYSEVSISEIATDVISQNENWEMGIVEESETFEHPEGGIHPFTQSGETDLEFLNRLALFAKSKKTGACSYAVTMEDLGTKPIIHFKPENLEDEVDSFTFSLADVSNAKSGRVISYSPDLSIINAAVTFKTVESEAEAEEVQQSLEPNTPEKEGEECLIGDSTEYTKFKTDSLSNRMANLVFQSTLEVWGIDWNVMPQSTISIYAYRNNGMLHYSSGRYYVQKVTNTLQGGVQRQTIECHRTSSFGNIDKEVAESENEVQTGES
ncbi:MAG: hypothetical protein ACRC0R_06525 [Cetobacterium sp.]